MSVKANVAYQNDVVITLCKIICVFPISELISGGSLHVLLTILNKKKILSRKIFLGFDEWVLMLPSKTRASRTTGAKGIKFLQEVASFR